MSIHLLFPEINLVEAKGPYRVDDERYSLPYIQRESWLIHHFFIKKRLKKGVPRCFGIDARDLRILKRWRRTC